MAALIGNDVPNAEKAKGNQKAEGRFRAVSSRAKRVETKDRDALRGTDLLGAFVTGLDGLADNEVKYVHERYCPVDRLRSENRPRRPTITLAGYNQETGFRRPAARRIFSGLWGIWYQRASGGTRMFLTLAAICAAVLCLLIGVWIKRKRDRQDMERHSITPEALHALLAANQRYFSMMSACRWTCWLIPNSSLAQRGCPQDVLENPSLVPKDKDLVVYCTCPSDKTSRTISQASESHGFLPDQIPPGWTGGLESEGLCGRALQ